MSHPSDPRIMVKEGDITALAVDAIVNAANSQLAPGAGVCGAIFRGAGPDLVPACRAVAPCPTGAARLTPGFDLLADHVIHTVGPVWHGGDQGEPELLAACYRASLDLAAENGLTSIAFPALSTGIFGYPLEAATTVAVATVRAGLADHPDFETVIFAVFGAEAEAAYRAALEA